MLTPLPETIWNLTHTDFQVLLDSGTLKRRNNTIYFYAPSFAYYHTKHFSSSTKTFSSISLTGNSCALNCKHCGGKILQTMHSAPSPEDLFKLGVKLKSEGTQGVLISGGCLPDGSVPLDAFADVLGRLKHELNLTVFVHTGLIYANTALLLKNAGIDAALIDVLGSNATMQQTLNLKYTTDDCAKSLKVLNQAKLNVMPHVTVGLNRGKLDGEHRALQIIQENCQPSAIVLIAFMPLPNTEMYRSPAPHPLDIAKVAATARQMFPDIPVVLGCMRPKGKLRAETDVLVIKAGVDGLAFPSEETITYAKNMGYQIVFSPYCCAQIHLDSSRT